jgi:hypothetical protein
MMNGSDSWWFTEELSLSDGDRSIKMDDQMMITLANPGSTREKMVKLLSILLLTAEHASL